MITVSGAIAPSEGRFVPEIVILDGSRAAEAADLGRTFPVC